MKTIIYNKTIRIVDPTPGLYEDLASRLSYTDKSKEYQLKRMAKNPFLRASQAYIDIQQDLNSSLVSILEDGSIEFPTGLLEEAYIPGCNIDDQRCETGTKISLPWANKPFDLRPYQQDIVDILPDNRRGLIKLATGLGKTLTAVYTIRSIGKKTLVVCPSTAIADQFYEILVSAFGDQKIGYFGGGKKKIRDITVGIAQSVNNHLDEFKKIGLGLVIVDETHHIAALTFYSIASALGDVGRFYGLTATDFRSDGKDILIRAACGQTIVDKDVVWGIQNGYLAQPTFLVREIDSKNKDYPDDKLKNYKSHVLNSPTTKAQILKDAQAALAAGKKLMILVDELVHGEELAKQLGLPFAQGSDKNSEKYINDFNLGKVPGLIGSEGKLGEGVDTRPVQVLIMANFVAAKGAVLQAIGRGLRLTDTKKTCLIIDYRITNSKMFARHADSRLKLYRAITDKVVVSQQK